MTSDAKVLLPRGQSTPIGKRMDSPTAMHGLTAPNGRSLGARSPTPNLKTKPQIRLLGLARAS